MVCAHSNLDVCIMFYLVCQKIDRLSYLLLCMYLISNSRTRILSSEDIVEEALDHLPTGGSTDAPLLENYSTQILLSDDPGLKNRDCATSANHISMIILVKRG